MNTSDVGFCRSWLGVRRARFLATSLGKLGATSRRGQRRSAPGMAWQAELSAGDRRAGW